jgi:tRNA-specific adenosine deaminase 1
MWILAAEIAALLSIPLPMQDNSLNTDLAKNNTPYKGDVNGESMIENSGKPVTKSNIHLIQNALLGRVADPSPTPSSSSPTPTITTPSSSPTYKEVKDTLLLKARRRVKEDARRLALKGWVRNQGDDDFVLENPISLA